MKRFALILAVLALVWADPVEACPLNLGFQQQAFAVAAPCQAAFPQAFAQPFFGVQQVAQGFNLRLGGRHRGVRHAPRPRIR